MNYQNLTCMQIDALREVFNIGSGNSVTALSSMLNRKIDMSVPKVKIVELQEILDGEVEKAVVAVLVKVFGDAPGSILYVFNENVASNIAQSLLGDCSNIFGELETSTLGEIGNIVASSYMNAIANFTSLTLIPSVPAVAYDSFNAIFASTYIEAGQYDDYVLEIETLFKGENGSDIMGKFYYIPEPGSLENILKNLGMS